MANRSPPTPFIIGSITPRAAFAATAASTALPPRARIAAPACEATAWRVATTPYCVITIERDCSRAGSWAPRKGGATKTHSSAMVVIVFFRFRIKLPLFYPHSYFEKNLSLIQNHVHCETHSQEGERVEQRSKRSVGQTLKCVRVETPPQAGMLVATGNLNPGEQRRKKLGKHVSGTGVGPEDEPWPRPCSSHLLYIKQQVADEKQHECAAGCEQHVGTGPEFLVDGEPNIPELSHRQPGERCNQQSPGALGHRSCSAQP